MSDDTRRPQPIDLPARPPARAPAASEMPPRPRPPVEDRVEAARRAAQARFTPPAPAAPDRQEAARRAAQSRFGAYQTPPPSHAPPGPAIGEHPHLASALAQAHAIDPGAAGDPRFRSRLDKCLALKAADLISWGEHNLEGLRTASDTQAAVARKIATLNAVDVADKCRAESTRPPTMVERITHADRPRFYRQTLTTVRMMLVDIGKEISIAHDTLGPQLAGLRLDILALQVTTDTLTETFARTTADGRLRTLVTGQQMAAMALQTFENMAASNLKLMQDIDQLLTVVIPGWSLARS